MKPIRYLQEYFLTLDEGKGSAYERYALNQLLSDVVTRYPITSVCELPANGVMGVPGIKSLILGLMQKQVTLVNPSQKALDEMKRLWQCHKLEAGFIASDYYHVEPLADESFDLVWNFCVAEHFERPQDVITEMKRLSRKYVLIVIQNVFNIGYPIHKLYHHIKKEPWDHGRFDEVKLSCLRKMCLDAGLKIVKEGGVDMPPWPDINMKLGDGKKDKADLSAYCDEFAALRPGVSLKDLDKIVNEWDEGQTCPYPWWMWGMALWYYLIEKPMPQVAKILVSHHPYIIAEKV